MNKVYAWLLVVLVVMVSFMALHINLGNMLHDEPMGLINTIASGLYLVVWMALAAHSIMQKGSFSAFLSFYWVICLLGAAICVVTIADITRVLEYIAYASLFMLAPLFGLRIFYISDLGWVTVLTAVSFCFAVASFVALDRKTKRN